MARVLVGNIKGPKGDIGDVGPQGIQGPVGPTGPRGETGATGAQGPTGAAGSQGVQGPQGNPGPGVPTGGAVGQVLIKNSASNFDTKWSDDAHSNRNLLDNWYFPRPINQRGVSGTISVTAQEAAAQNFTGKYFIDRWKLMAAGNSATLSADGIILNGTMKQVLEFPAGTDVCCHVKMVSGTATVSYDNSSKTFTLTSSGGCIEAVKLEKGSVSTLDNDPPPDYGQELRKCQRYFVKAYTLGLGGYNSIASGFQQSARDVAYMTMILPVEMRQRPSISPVGKFVFRCFSGQSNAAGSYVTTVVMTTNANWVASSLRNNTLYFSVTIGTNDTQLPAGGSVCDIMQNNDSTAYVLLNAEL